MLRHSLALLLLLGCSGGGTTTLTALPDAGSSNDGGAEPDASPSGCSPSEYREYCPDGTLAAPSPLDCEVHCPPTTCEKLSEYMATFPLGVSVACEKDGDCESVPFATGCFDRCTSVIATRAWPDYKSRLAELEYSTSCKAFKAQGCTVEVPPCDPPAPPKCVDNRCQ